ncbi:hypothetical protein H0A36_24395 [Endozoicomonas sp. SM1973]|uniref:Uncharacterized protein n=1 Tax=Spartinivicinus marinus TaxID=2994442 RepID=A0A853IJA4_9GAMM|nr:hypothetical protein [Spartinivicinus marinus]
MHGQGRNIMNFLHIYIILSRKLLVLYHLRYVIEKVYTANINYSLYSLKTFTR